MQTYTLPNGMEISGLSMGTWGFSGAAVWGKNDDDVSIRTIHEAMDLGINLFDSAARYGDGKAEEVLGLAIKDRRDKALVATKVYMGDLSYESVLEQCEQSLSRLGTDYIDIYQIHWPNPKFPADETMRAFKKLKADGKIRGFAVCNHGPKAMSEVADSGVLLNQLPYSLIWRLIEHDVAPACAEHKMAIWAYSPLAQGLLTGKYLRVEDVPMNRRSTRFYSGKWEQGRHNDDGFESIVFPFLTELDKACARTGYSMAELALAFLKTRPNMGSILVGSRNPEQLRQNIKAYNAEIPAEIISEITKLSDSLLAQMGTNPDMWENQNGGRMY